MKVWCSHRIASATLRPVAYDQVEVRLGGDVRGTNILPMDPLALQDWIYQHTRLSCFSFDFADLFGQLLKEHEKFERLESRRRAREEIEQLREQFTEGTVEAAEVRNTWESCPNHGRAEATVSAGSWKPSRWTETEDVEASRTLTIKQW